jgi:hypothetical protein
MSASVSWLTLAITGSCFPSLPKFVVGVGCFLGMGEKDVAVPFNAVQVTNKNNNKWHLVMNSTKDALKNAKGFKYDLGGGLAGPPVVAGASSEIQVIALRSNSRYLLC